MMKKPRCFYCFISEVVVVVVVVVMVKRVWIRKYFCLVLRCTFFTKLFSRTQLKCHFINTIYIEVRRIEFTVQQLKFGCVESIFSFLFLFRESIFHWEISALEIPSFHLGLQRKEKERAI